MTKIRIPIETKGAKKAQQEIKGVGGQLGKLAKSAGIAAAAYMGANALVSSIKASVDAFAQQELAEKKLEKAFKILKDDEKGI